jgi:hypothetical protein
MAPQAEKGIIREEETCEQKNHPEVFFYFPSCRRLADGHSGSQEQQQQSVPGWPFTVR